MLTFSLQSGSNGNSIYVEAGDARLLFDAGISGRQAKMRLAEHGRDIRDVDAIILSHLHSDHTRGAGVWHRLFGLPVYGTRATQQAIAPSVGKIRDFRSFAPGDDLTFDGVTVHTIPTPHDAPESVAFVIEHDRRRLGIFTDLGHPFGALAQSLSEVDAAYLESNYDPTMLAEGPYPAELQARIRGRGGHLSNHESVTVLGCCRRSAPRWVALAHLSEHNNHPDIALATARKVLGRDYPLQIASRYRASRMWEV